jgi:hypothetical protein
MLEAILTGSSLPGRRRPLNLSDLPLLLDREEIILSTENLGGPVSVVGTPKPIYLLPQEAILERARAEGDLPYLQFQPATRVEDGVLLTLQILIATRVPGSPSLGLSGVQVTFRQNDGRWEADEETAEFAA